MKNGAFRVKSIPVSHKLVKYMMYSRVFIIGDLLGNLLPLEKLITSARKELGFCPNHFMRRMLSNHAKNTAWTGLILSIVPNL